METLRLLQEFFNASHDDGRLSPVHISVYAVLFSLWVTNGATNPLLVDRKRIMKLAKVSARMTFYKCLNELHEYGFINYVPSANQFLNSQVYLMDPDEKISLYKKYI